MLPAALTLLLATPAADPAAPDPVLIEAVRELAVGNLDTASRNLEFLGDSRVFWVFEPGELASLIAAAGRSAKDTGIQLEKVAGLKGLTKEDAAAVARLRKVADSLQKQAKLLQMYWDTGVIDYGDEADKVGGSARKELDELLGLNKPGTAPTPREPGKKP